MITATSASPTRTYDVFGLLDPATYRRSLHLLIDLPPGLITFTLATTLVALSAGLTITVVGVPLLVGTLFAAALLGRLERFRARLLLGVDVAAPAAPNGWKKWLADTASWRALGYALLLGPAGLVIGTLTLMGWSTAVAAIAFPAYAWALHDAALHLGAMTIGGAPAAVGSVVCGLLLAAMPAVIRRLARIDVVLVRGLLR